MCRWGVIIRVTEQKERALLCRETGLDCDYIIKGETEEDILKNGTEHIIQVHDMKKEDIYFNTIPANFLCQTIPKLEAPASKWVDLETTPSWN